MVKKVWPICQMHGMIIATDFSPEMIKTAKSNYLNYPNKNFKFIVMDNLNMTFPNDIFDIISARHTPIDAKQIYNCLTEKGVLIIEGIDKYDCWELKEQFSRGQAYDNAIAIGKKDYEDITKAGFSKIDFHEVIQYEYYKTEKDLLKLLVKTPILNDFCTKREIEKSLFDKYISTHTTPKGIELKRVLYGIVAIK